MGLRVEPGPATDDENLELLMRGEIDAMITNLEGRYWSLFGPDILDHDIALDSGRALGRTSQHLWTCCIDWVLSIAPFRPRSYSPSRKLEPRG